jgi:hypothetical protein
MKHAWIWVLAASLGGCKALEDLQPDVPNCDPRTPFWLDADGDGVGDEGTIYLGCEAPDGYVQVPPASDTDSPDTDVSDTDLHDTDGVDTDTAPTDTDQPAARRGR